MPVQKKAKANMQATITSRCAEMYEEKWKLKQTLQPIATPEPTQLRALAAGSNRGVFLCC